MSSPSSSELKRIPFDSFVLQAIVEEIGPYVGGKVQDIRQPDNSSLCLGIYAGGREAMLLVSCHPVFSRVHFITKRPYNQKTPPVFLSAVRSRLEGARLVGAHQVYGDRVLELDFESAVGDFRLVCELMGKHSNVMLLDSTQRIVAALKWVPASKSSRPILPNSIYRLPPVMTETEDLKPSPFYSKLINAAGEAAYWTRKPVLVSGFGAYPVSVASLGYSEFTRDTLSIALEQYYDTAIPKAVVEAARTALASQLRRTLESREASLKSLREAEESGGRASDWQRIGELILAYGPSAGYGASEVTAWDYDGSERRIPLDPEKSFKDNAQAFFDRAKHAKGRLGIVREQIARIESDTEDLYRTLIAVDSAEKIDSLEALKEQAAARKWTHAQSLPIAKKEDRPYEGHRIRELLAPGGYTVLFGENAESNDYLTLRVAKPNDWWLHVRGATSAHVVICTRNQPDRVQPETLRFAAKVAVQNSTSKHSGYVPVDYTLKKYVRKPRGAAKGSALYTHEKTVHVETDG